MRAGMFWELVKTAGAEWVEDKAARLGAALAYYTIFSMAPLIVIAIGVIGLIYGEDAAQGHVMVQIEHQVGTQAAEIIRTMIEHASERQTGLLGSVLGIVMLLVGATGLFGQLQDALDTIWEVKPRPGRGWWNVVKDRFLSFLMVLGVACLLLASLAVSAALAAAANLLGEWQISYAGQVMNILVDLAVITLLFAMIYRFLPDAEIAWRDVWLGALVTAVLFTLGKYLISLYIGFSGTSSAYGAAGSLAVLLVWLYYSAQIFLFGAELTQVYANRVGSGMTPAANAQPVTEADRAQQGIPHDNPT